MPGAYAHITLVNELKEPLRLEAIKCTQGLELTHFAIESATELLSVLPCLCVARRQAKLPDHHPENLKLAFRKDDRTRL